MNKLEQAMEDQKQGKWQQADEVYKEILEEEPENADVMYVLATSQMSQNKLEQALKTINKALLLEDKAGAYYQLKGSIQARTGQTEEALNTINLSLKYNPNLYQSHILAGHLYTIKGDRKDAIKHFKMAEKINPNMPEAQVSLAKVMLEEGDIEKAINTLRTIEKEHPEQASVKMMMGEAFIENGAYNFAENYFQKVLAMHPEYDLAGLYLGIAKLQTGDSANAEKLITTFNQTHPNTREGLAGFGMLLFKQRRFRAAVEYLRKAIGQGLAPLSWRSAFVESLAKLGQYDAAIEFYKSIQKKHQSQAFEFRLGELYERSGKLTKAKKKYKKIEKTNSKYVASQLGLARIYLSEKNTEKASKASKNVLAINVQHAEATLLYLTSILMDGKQEKALTILENLNYENLNDVYKKTFRIQHGMILDNQQKYTNAMAVFKDESKAEKTTTPTAHKITDEELKQIKGFTSKIEDKRKDPVFIIGTQSTALNEFVMWLYSQGVKVLNDRLVSLGRPDILHTFKNLDVIDEADDDMVRLERKIYHQKAKALMSAVEEGTLIADCLYLNPLQISIIKKFFPNAKIIFLTRKVEDVWLNQEVFGKEPISSDDLEKTKTQLLSLDLNIISVDTDKWLENDKQTLETLSEIFEQTLSVEKRPKQNYWRKSMFEKGHWKNYKK